MSLFKCYRSPRPPQKGVSKCFYNYIFRLFFIALNELGQGYVFTRVCDSVHRGWYPSMHCRWYPSMPCSRSRGGWYPSMPCRIPGLHPRGKLRGLARGISRPTPGGVSPGPQKGGGLLREQWGSAPGGACSGGVWSPPCDSYCCGRYASYWNAFLYKLCEIRGNNELIE